VRASLTNLSVACLIGMAASATAADAAVIVSWGSGGTAPSSSNTVSTGWATNTINLSRGTTSAGTAFSDSSSFNPPLGSIYYPTTPTDTRVGRNPVFYGGWENGGSGTAGGVVANARSATGGDLIRVAVQNETSATSADYVAVLMLWNKADFQNDLATAADVQLSPTDTLTAYVNSDTANGVSREARIVIREGSTYYISAATTVSTDSIATVTASQSTSWFTYNPTTSIGDLSALSAATPTFQNITAVGLWARARATSSGTRTQTVNVYGFEATAVPEPAALGAAALLAPLAMRRRRAC
jgi:MYXO-CTERM domain-containing protein